MYVWCIEKCQALFSNEVSVHIHDKRRKIIFKLLSHVFGSWNNKGRNNWSLVHSEDLMVFKPKTNKQTNKQTNKKHKGDYLRQNTLTLGVCGLICIYFGDPWREEFWEAVRWGINMHLWNVMEILLQTHGKYVALLPFCFLQVDVNIFYIPYKNDDIDSQ